MEDNPKDAFRYMEQFFRIWLEQARKWEIQRLLELVQACRARKLQSGA